MVNLTSNESDGQRPDLAPKARFRRFVSGMHPRHESQTKERRKNLEDVEFESIRLRRLNAFLDKKEAFLADLPDEELKSLRLSDKKIPRHERQLTGLAFSGGGIRSATFGLGVLQGLAELGLLKHFDYLSTVSGGGFIGSWFATWVKREGSLENVIQQLNPERAEQAKAVRGFKKEGEPYKIPKEIPEHEPREQEPNPIFHLRQYSNYLTPRLSFFSGDSWTLIAIYLRNLIASQLVFLPLVFSVAFLVRWIALGFSPVLSQGACHWLLGASSLALTIGMVLILGGTPPLRSKTASSIEHNTGQSERISDHRAISKFLESGWCLVSIVACLTLSALGISIIGFHWVVAEKYVPFDANTQYLSATLGPPSILILFAVFKFLSLFLLSSVKNTNEQQREWRSRLFAWMLIITCAWTAIFDIVLFGPTWIPKVGSLWQYALTAGWITSALGGLLAARSAKTDGNQRSLLNLIGTIAPFVFVIGLGCATSYLVELLPSDIKSWPERCCVIMAVAAVFSGFLFDVNLFSLNAMYANRLARCYLGASRRKDLDDSENSRHPDSGTASHAYGPEWKTHPVTGFDPSDDLPLNSLQIGKKDFLGFGAPMKEPDQKNKRQKRGDNKDDNCKPYWGPYPLINTAMNLVAGEQLAWQERKAESFVLSPLYCGANSLGYRPTAKFAAGKNKKHSLTVGRAVAISGAAANPNMGYHSSPAATALMTIFNVRLGWWLPNPRKDLPENIWENANPFGLRWPLCELFGFTHSKSRFLNISDGGHFENLGVYELIRRRCRFIVVSDAGADPKFEFEDLNGLIRKCRTDFGVDIEIDLSQLRPKKGERQSKWHCAIGTIRYDHVEATAPVGLLVYLKPSLTGNEPADVQHYANQNAEFPHEPTSDQFFTESQFESYRALGYHCVTETFRKISKRIQTKLDKKVALKVEESTAITWEKVRYAHLNLVENLVWRTRKEWAVPVELDERFLHSVESFVDLHRDLRDDNQLRQVSERLRQLSPRSTLRSLFISDRSSHSQAAADLRTALTVKGVKHLPAEVHTACQMLQSMENAWLTVKLEHNHAHPMNAGWMNVFHRWSNTSLLRRYWPQIRGEFSREFVEFCEHETMLKVSPDKDAPSNLKLFDELPDDVKNELYKEHAHEWPEEYWEHNKIDFDDKEHDRSLETLSKSAWEFQEDFDDFKDEKFKITKGQRAFWFLPVSLKVPIPDGPLNDGVVGGVLGLRWLHSYEEATRKESQDFDAICKEIEAGTDHPEVKRQERQRARSSIRRKLNEPARAYELFLWVRPGFRQQKIGQRMIQSFQRMLWDQDNDHTPKELGKKIGADSKFLVYFPKSGWSGSAGDKLQRGQWLSYFAFYGYRKLGNQEDAWPALSTHEILVRDMHDLVVRQF